MNNRPSQPRPDSPPARPFKRAIRRLLAALHDDRGGAAISFVLTFPIFLIIVGIIVQYALIINAKVNIDRAAQAAARAAITCLPDEQPERVSQAARMSLVPLSPEAKSPIAAEAEGMYDSLRRMGVNTAETFPRRYTYAMEATRVTWNPRIDFLHSAGREIEVMVVYRYYLTVPGAMQFISGNTETIAGVTGKFVDIASRVRVQTVHGRQARTRGDGWPG